MEATIRIEAEEVKILNDIIVNSRPTYSYGVIAEFVSKINKQLVEQFQKEQEVQPAILDAE